jgi:uncharacterized protein YjbJ (UPF0337 family)
LARLLGYTGGPRRQPKTNSEQSPKQFVSPSSVCQLGKGITVDKDRIKGMAKEVKGAVRENVGKATGDAKTETEGKAEKAAGKVQNAVGGLKDAARGK